MCGPCKPMLLVMASPTMCPVADKICHQWLSMTLCLSTACPNRRRSGMTLVELMIGLGIGSLVLMSIMMILITSHRSFVALGNYSSMEQLSRNAVDQMTRDIRKVKNLISFSTNEVVFNYVGPTNLTYFYNPGSRQLIQWKTGGQTNVL